MLKRFISYYKPHKALFWADMIASMAVSLIAVFYPIMTRRMVNGFTEGDHPDFRMIFLFGGALLLLYAARMGLNFFIQYKGHMMGVRIQARMRSDLFAHLETLPYSFYDEHETGKIMSRLTNDLMDISELAHHGPENLLISSISIVTAFAYLASINIWLTLIIFGCTPFLFFIAMTLRRRMREAFSDSRKAIAEINGAAQSSISGIRVTKAFDNSEVEKEKFESGNASLVKARGKAYKAMGQFHSSTSFITDAFNVIVLIAGGVFLYRGVINYGDYSAFIVAVNMFISPVMTLINFMEQYQDGVTGFSRFLELMDTAPEPELPGARELENVKGEIELQNVTFDYGNGREVLKNVSLHIPVGSTYALVGPSGGGKTTICHLLPRFYLPEKGEIRIDGHDVRDITLSCLRRNIGIVQQDVYLFGGTIRDNILYGRPDATEEEVIEAAKRANIHDFIMELEHGYDSEIGERGVRLSGGQKQRLSIARVFLKNPPILILDEATSALDNTTEMLIQRSLDELCRGRTTLVVAHRLSTIKNADEIAVISAGEVLETGNHASLLAKDGVYASLYRGQFSEDNSRLTLQF